MPRMVRLLLCLALTHAFAHAVELTYKHAPITNPLKGLVWEGYYRFDRDIPHTLEYENISLSRLMPGRDRFDWSSLDASLEKFSQRGLQVIIRVVLDWPGLEGTVPEFLLGSTHLVADSHWRNGERFPDYESPEIRVAVTNFIAAFGARYDGNPNIGFIEAGLLGACGEWLPVNRVAPTAPLAVQKEVLDAFEAAFHTTRILVRYPSELTIDRAFGYHDDWFGHKDRELPTFFSKLKITDSSHWKKSPIGARIFPEIQNCIFNDEPCRYTEQEYLDRIRSNHISYLRLGSSDGKGPGRQRMLMFAQALGYELYVCRAEISAAHNSLTIAATITNTGIAPFYYKWPVEIALASAGQIQQTGPTDWDLRQILPHAKAKTFEFHVTETSLPAGKYLVLLRVRNPAPNGPLFSFANAAQNSSVESWLTLGDFINLP